jgi:IS6 family transposase
VALCVSGDRPVRAGHRRAGVRSGIWRPPADFSPALGQVPRPAEVTTDRAQAYQRVLDELLPAACHVLEKYANNPIESDHGQLKSRLRPMRGLQQLRCARVITTGHAFIQNIRRGHDELGVEEEANLWVLAAFDELILAI